MEKLDMIGYSLSLLTCISAWLSPTQPLPIACVASQMSFSEVSSLEVSFSEVSSLGTLSLGKLRLKFDPKSADQSSGKSSDQSSDKSSEPSLGKSSDQSFDRLYHLAESITVKVKARQNGGSGVLLERRGPVYTVLTNRHVVNAGSPYLIQTPDGRVHPANLLKKIDFRGNDLALLQFRSQLNYAIAPLAPLVSLNTPGQSSPKIGDPVLSAGFPLEPIPNSSVPEPSIPRPSIPNLPKTNLPNANFSKPNLPNANLPKDDLPKKDLPKSDLPKSEPSKSKLPNHHPSSKGLLVTTGQVSLIPNLPFQGGYQLGYSNPIYQGMSGGPVLNKQGQVIGINSLHAYPLWGDPYIFKDGSKPPAKQRSLIIQSSWAVPISTFLGEWVKSKG